MGKKIVVFGTMLFLLFEVLYFNSNITTEEYAQDESKENVYALFFEDGKEGFLEDYQDIVLEEKEDIVVVLTSSEKVKEIDEKYNIRIEK